MDFNLSEEELAFRHMAAEFAKKQFAPNADKWDEEGHFPREELKNAASLGLGGILAKEDIGGSGLTRLASAIIFEQLATGCISTSAFLSIHNMVTSLIDHYANEALRQKFGPQLTSMSLMGSYCLTEPESGSDAASLKTRAVLEGDHYVVNGSKAFISGGGSSDVYLTMVRTGAEGYQGISCLLIESDREGISSGKLEKKMGWHSQPTAMLFFENCRIPVSHLVGKEGEGFKIALNALNGGRINIAACSLGGALTALRTTQQYMNERKQFGKYLKEFQALRFYFADMMTEFEAARLMVYRAAKAMDDKDPNAPLFCAMAKRLTTDICFKISDKAMQLHGGYGYLRDYQIERIFRDLRVHQILEGTNEIMREIIAKTVLDKPFEIE